MQLQGQIDDTPLYHREPESHTVTMCLFASLRPASVSGYLLCRLPEVSGVGQPAVEFGQLLQHVGQLGEGGPVSQVVRPAGREDLLRRQDSLESAQCRPYMNDLYIVCVYYLLLTHLYPILSTHSDLLAEADLCQDLLYTLSAAHLPDGGFHRLVGDWPVPRLELIPNGA